MFDSVKENKKNSKQGKAIEPATTVIGPGILIEGTSFKGTGTIRIDGVFVGEMFVDGHIIVGQPGEIRGNVTVTSMQVAGTVVGNIICRENVSFEETALVEGDIQTSSISIDEGAQIIGTLNTRKKDLMEPINLDEAVKSITTSGKRAIEQSDEKIGFYFK